MQPPIRTLSPREERFVIAVDRTIYHFARHWVWALNAIGAFFVALPLAAPVLAATGHSTAALWIYRTFSFVCHQRPERSFFIFDHKIAYCQRDTAIYMGILMLGVLYPLVHRWVRPLGLRSAVLLSLPIAIDGFTQLLGFRESTWELRVITGGLFALAVAWLALPRLEQGFGEIRQTLEGRFERLVREGRARPL